MGVALDDIIVSLLNNYKIRNYESLPNVVRDFLSKTCLVAILESWSLKYVLSTDSS
jgi:hypothetical protein